jgi:hypothetical protein
MAHEVESGALAVVLWAFWGSARLVLFALPIAIFTLFLSTPERLHQVAQQDRTYQYWEAQPLSLLPLWHQAFREEVPRAALAKESVDPASMTAPRGGADVINQSLAPVDDVLGLRGVDDQIRLYLGVIWPRGMVLVPLLPGIILALMVGWSLGRAKNHRMMREGWAPAPHHFRWGRYTVDFCLSLMIAWLVIPVSLPVIVVLPLVVVAWFSIIHTALHKG